MKLQNLLNVYNVFTNTSKVTPYSDLTIGQSNIANVIIVVLAVYLFTTIIRNKFKTS